MPQTCESFNLSRVIDSIVTADRVIGEMIDRIAEQTEFRTDYPNDSSSMGKLIKYWNNKLDRIMSALFQ